MTRSGHSRQSPMSSDELRPALADSDELCYALAILIAFQRILIGPDELCRL
jgi:hypothetical protein